MKNRLTPIVILLVILTPLFHEFAHFLTYSINGVSAKITYGFTTTDKFTFLGVLGGPLFNILVALLSFVLIYINKKQKLLWFIIGTTTIISRLVTCILIIFLSIILNPVILQNNDEGKLAYFMGISPIFLYVFFILIYILLTFLLIKSIKNNKLSRDLIFKTTTYTLILNIGIILIL